MSEESDVGSLIPQVFYDLISRVAPGAVILPSLLVAWWGPRDFWKNVMSGWTVVASEHAPHLLLGLSLVTLSYYSGVLVRGFGYLASALLGRIGGKRKGIDFNKYYRIKVGLPAAGSRVAKMKAESSMAGVLAMGLGISLVVNLFRIWHGDAGERLALGLLLVSAMICLEAYRREVHKRLQTSIALHYDILKEIETRKP